MAIDGAKFRTPVEPGVMLRLEVEFIQKRPFPAMLESPTSLHYQLLFGVVAGAAYGAVQWALLTWWPRWRAMQTEAIGRSPQLIGSVGLIVLIAVIVGITEEILFRAAIQPLIGIVPASILFTLVHLNLGSGEDGTKPDIAMAVLSVGVVFGASILLGALFDEFGLAASIAGHIVYDMIVLLALRNVALRSSVVEV